MIRDLSALSRPQLEDLVEYYEGVLGLREDRERLGRLRLAFALPAGPAWLLSRLAAADGLLVTRDALLQGVPDTDRPRDRSPRTLDGWAADLRAGLGAECLETVPGRGWRVTPLGRLKIRRALGEGATL